MLIEFESLLKKYKINISGLSHFGAHLGQEVEEYRKAGSFPIHLFEPQKEIFSELSKSFSKEENIYLYNLEGKQLNFISVNATKAVLNTSDLISGNYLLKISFDSGSSIEHKIIVQ